MHDKHGASAAREAGRSYRQRRVAIANMSHEAEVEGGTEPTTINLLGLVLWIIRKVRGK